MLHYFHFLSNQTGKGKKKKKKRKKAPQDNNNDNYIAIIKKNPRKIFAE